MANWYKIGSKIKIKMYASLNCVKLTILWLVSYICVMDQRHTYILHNTDLYAKF